MKKILTAFGLGLVSSIASGSFLISPARAGSAAALNAINAGSATTAAIGLFSIPAGQPPTDAQIQGAQNVINLLTPPPGTPDATNPATQAQILNELANLGITPPPASQTTPISPAPSGSPTIISNPETGAAITTILNSLSGFIFPF